MARVFLSSTYRDLKDYRATVYVALRRLGHQSVAVEDWAATEKPVLERTLADLLASDVIIFLVGWQYGYIPPGQSYSMTELEFRSARESGKPCLIFLVAQDAPWPREYFDHDLSAIRRFRQQLLEQFVVAFFTTPDELARQVAASLARWVESGSRELSPTPPEAVPTGESLGPQVFLSYAHEDVGVAQSISKRIGHENWSVFWDREIPVGFTWDDIVEQALDAAKCVVVLWSPAARNSEWVRIEAADGAERGILTPAIIQQTKIPLRFRRIQAADLVGWTAGATDTPGMHALIAAISRCVRRQN